MYVIMYESAKKACGLFSHSKVITLAKSNKYKNVAATI